MVTIKELEKLGVKFAEGIDEAKLYPVLSIMNLEMAKEIIGMFLNRGYDLSAIHLATCRLFTLNKKELNVLKENLDKIDALNLKDVFNNNLNIVSFNSSVIARVEFCLNNGIPFVYEESKILISELYNEELFAEYTASRQKVSEVATQDEVKSEESTVTRANKIELTEEDNIVRSELIKTLLEIKEENRDNFTFGFLITSIIANLDLAIANDNGAYKTVGTKHLIDRALEGIALTPEMQADIKEKIFPAFQNETIERSA